MSADSPNHSRPELTAPMHNVVTPQPVTDPTILDSVAGFINEVVPTAGNDTLDVKDQIQWAKFEYLDWDDTVVSPNNETPVPSSLILVLGYTTGIQVWAIPANGEAIELFSWRHGSVKVLRILPAPYEVGVLHRRDAFENKRPLVALVDVAVHGSSAGSLNVYSLKTGEQVKQIKFKSQILDVLANRRSVVITFAEKIAVFDAFTLEDKLSITSCYLSPGIHPNPVALGPRWLAFAEKKLIASRRSSGGNEGEGVQSYTATVLHAAKSLGRGLRELGDAVASSLTGNQSNKLGTSPNSPQAGGSADVPQKGILTILDVESSTTQNADGSLHPESIVAHFVAHTEAIVYLQFGPCGMLLLTADKRGHDFHLFRINPHPVGSALAAVHHLYTLHRGDTSAKVQDMCFSFDSRWVTVSTLRGTTHVFPITPYGGNIGVRTHTTPHVVNKMSRFHRSAGLTAEGRSNSPVSMFETPATSNFPYHNPRFAPFPHPTVVNPLAQLRQPVYMQNIGNSAPRPGRQRLTSSSEDNIALRVAACFAPARAWIDSAPVIRETVLNKQMKPVDSLFIMNCHGTLVQYDLEPHHASHISKERVCDDSQIELTVIAKAQWRLQRQPTSIDRPLPVPHHSLVFIGTSVPTVKKPIENGNDDDWLSQVEIITHAGPHRRLWMGPQFTFKTYTTANGTQMTLSDAQPLDLNRSKPVNMPITKANAVLIESSSASSSEQSLLDIYRRNAEEMGAAGEHQIKEDLADAMIESPGSREVGGRCVIVSVKPQPVQRPTAPAPIAKVVNPLGTVVTIQSDEESDVAVPEDIVIYENCDETLFRPLVSPRTLAYCKSSKADSENIMMQSLRGDTEVTVRVLNKSEESKGHLKSSWDDPKIQDIKENTEVFVKEVSDMTVPIQNINDCNGKLKQKRNKDKFQNSSDKTQVLKNEKNVKGDVVSIGEYSTPKSVKDNNKNYHHGSELLQHETNNVISNKVAIDLEPETKIPSTEKEVASSTMEVLKLVESEVKTSIKKDILDDSSVLIVSSISRSSKSKKGKKSLGKKISEDIEKSSDSTDSLSSKENYNKNSNVSSELAAEYNKEAEKELCAEVTNSYPENIIKQSWSKSNREKEVKEKNSQKICSGLLKDIDIVEEINFSSLDKKLVNPEFPPLEENFFSLENIPKIEKFEDAEDCGLPLEPIESFYSETDQKKSNEHSQDAKPNKVIKDDTSTSEDNIIDKFKEEIRKKSPVKKPRKPKTKLGIKIGGVSKESTSKSSIIKESVTENVDTVSEVSTDVTLSIPKRTWSSIVAAPQRHLASESDINSSLKNSVSESIANYTITLPKKSLSDVTTSKLLDIETPEERQLFHDDLDNLLDVNKSENFSKIDTSSDLSNINKLPTDLLKLSDKSSDDEKADSGSSKIESTESSDEGKILETPAADDVFKDPTSLTMSITKSNTKKRVKKKRK